MRSSYKVITVQSYKGGTGKTYTACNLADGLSHQGHCVCTIDGDLQSPDPYHLGSRVAYQGSYLTDFLMSDGQKTAEPDEVCCMIREDSLYTVPGKPDFETARSITGYLLAEDRAGLLGARIQVLMKALNSSFGIKVFILDCAPGFFGMASAGRKLADETGGVVIHMFCRTPADQEGLLQLQNFQSPNAKVLKVINRETGIDTLTNKIHLMLTV